MSAPGYPRYFRLPFLGSAAADQTPPPAGLRAISSTWRSPITPRAGGNGPPNSAVHSGRPFLASLVRTTLPGLPPARGVIALREVVVMARPPPRHSNRRPPAVSPISETCPPGEGYAFQRDMAGRVRGL